MNARWLVLSLVALLSGLAPTASAHRLNEYLQATTIALAPDHLTLHLRLTPGTDVAPQVLGSLDTNHDGALSPLSSAPTPPACSTTLRSCSTASRPRCGWWMRLSPRPASSPPG